jgi:uncharacterized protein
MIKLLEDRMQSVVSCIAAMALSASATAASAVERTIVVSGVGQVLTAPDLALATLNLRGEGPTPDAATGSLVKTLQNVQDGLSSGLSGVRHSWTAEEMSINAVRGDDCDAGYDSPRLSTGPCAIKGFVATMTINLEVYPPDQVGTVLGLASRLGAETSNAAAFALKDPQSADQQAASLALADAQKKARAIAEGSGVRLGPMVNVTDSMAIAMDIPPPPGAAAAAPRSPSIKAREPVAVALRPELVVTKAQLVVTFSILP